MTFLRAPWLEIAGMMIAWAQVHGFGCMNTGTPGVFLYLVDFLLGVGLLYSVVILPGPQ